MSFACCFFLYLYRSLEGQAQRKCICFHFADITRNSISSSLDQQEPAESRGGEEEQRDCEDGHLVPVQGGLQQRSKTESEDCQFAMISLFVGGLKFTVKLFILFGEYL